ncbi:serine/threonine-protein phosphatase 6 regulatory subunit 2 isoform X7 [Ictidomys tridecemlineatus]
MFWKFDLNTTSHVDKLLDREQVTLQELMDEDDILQECKAQNRKLLDFLCRPQCMEELVSLITQDPPLDMEEKVRFKYPNTACELLTCDVPQISDRLGEDESLLSLLYDFLDQEPPLNPLLASFFSKTIGNLIARKTEQVIAFLKKKDKFISLVLKHMGTSALMDLLLRLVSCVEPAGLRQEVLHWLNEEKIIQRLVELIHPHQDEDRQSNASQALCDIVRLGRDQSSQLPEALEPDPLLTTLESQDCVEQLLKNMFDGEQTESCLVSGTQVLLALLEPRRAGTEGLVDSFSQGLERPHAVSSSVLHGIEPRLKDFHQLLLHPPKKKAILTTVGVLEEPLGSARLHGARLVAALLHADTPSIHQELCRLSTMDLLLLFQKCCLVQRILEAWEANDHAQAAGGMRRGNMGHLTRIANAVVQNLERGPVQTHISEVIRGLPADCRGRWESFVEETLTETNRRNTVDLVSAHHLHSSSEDEDVEGAFPNELSLQQAFSEYQIQQMTANFVDQFGFNDEEFADQDDNINAPFDRIAEINFSIDADEDSPSAALFEACCSDRIQPFDDDEEEDIWEDEETRCTARVVSRARFGAPHTSEHCSKNALERGGQDRKAGSEADRTAPRAGILLPPAQNGGPPSESASEETFSGTTPHASQDLCSPLPPGHCQGAAWTAVFDEPGNPTTPAPRAVKDVGSSVWAASTSTPEEKGWAKFTDFQPFCCSESGPRCSSPVDVDHSHVEAGQSPDPGTSSGPASPCAWNVCVTGKAPLVTSDGEDEQKVAGTMGTVSTGPGREGFLPPRTEAAAVGRAKCADSTPLGPASLVPSEATSTPTVATPPKATVAATVLDKASPPMAAPVVSPAVAVSVPPGPTMVVPTAAPATVATMGTATKDRKTDAPPEGAALNGPV